jgi:hypothetical protein
VKEVKEIKENAAGVESKLRESGSDREELGEKKEEAPGPPKQLGKILVEMETVTPEDVAYAVQKQLKGDARSIGESCWNAGW